MKCESAANKKPAQKCQYHTSNAATKDQAMVSRNAAKIGAKGSIKQPTTK